MEKRRAFNPGDWVSTFTGQIGVVVSETELAGAQKILKEGKRPGHYFAPGCCHHPDYLIQIPVIFEDGRYDVMRAMNLRRTTDIPPEKRARLNELTADVLKEA